jgi:protein-L-isoaspartate(D-aspartate) O-methyltransferase
MRPGVEAACGLSLVTYLRPADHEDAYSADQAVITKQFGGEMVNSVSAAWLIAEMLVQAADAHEGGGTRLDVLEIEARRLIALRCCAWSATRVRSRRRTSIV